MPKACRGAAALVAAALCLGGTAAEARKPRRLPWNPKVDLTITGAGTAAWIATEAFKGEIAPGACRWCGTNGLDRAVRDALLWDDTHAAHVTSNVVAFALAPTWALGMNALAAYHDDRQGELGIDAILVAEATALALDLNQTVKFAAGRERPFVHALPPSEKGMTDSPEDNDLSFYSGHTTLVFSLAVSAGTVASMRGYRWAPWVWGGGLALATTTGYLRIAADKHWFTDVATGAVVGSAVGFLVPYWLHRPSCADPPPVVTVAPTVGGGVVSLAGGW